MIRKNWDQFLSTICLTGSLSLSPQGYNEVVGSEIHCAALIFLEEREDKIIIHSVQWHLKSRITIHLSASPLSSELS